MFGGKHARDFQRQIAMRDLDRVAMECAGDAALERAPGGFRHLHVGTQDVFVESDGGCGGMRADVVGGLIRLPHPVRMSAHRHGDGIGPRRCDINHAQLP